MKSSQLGINSISTRQETLPEALEAYAAAGFQNVEFHLPLVKRWLDQGHTVSEVRTLLDTHGLRSIGGFQLPLECFTPLAARQANHQEQIANASLINDLGGGTLVFGTDGPPEPSIEALHQVAATLRDFMPRIEQFDVRLALEFNWGPLVKSLQSAVLICAEVDHPQVGVLFDPAHYYTTVTKLADLNAETIPWIIHVHLDDMADKPGDLSNCNADRVLPGAGVLDLPAMVATLEHHGYDGFYSIEMFNEALWQLPATEAARRCSKSLEYLYRR